MGTVYGLPLDDLPDGWQPVEAIVVVKCLKPENEDCAYGLVARVSGDLTTWEAEGMAHWLTQVTRGDLDDHDEEG